MKKRLRKKYNDRIMQELVLKDLQSDYSQMACRLEGMARELQNNMIRVRYLLNDQNSILSRFPNIVKDWATDPVIHNGEYVIWFVSGEREFQTRKYTYVSGKWYTDARKEVDMRKLRPVMYQPVPVISDEVKEIYRRRFENVSK